MTRARSTPKLACEFAYRRRCVRRLEGFGVDRRCRRRSSAVAGSSLAVLASAAGCGRRSQARARAGARARLCRDARRAFAASAPGAAAASSNTIGEPSRTLSPTLTFTSFTVPAAGDGTSIVALSDSSVTSESPAFTASPGLTKTSITGTSVKSPMSGTLTSIVLIAIVSCAFRLVSHGAGLAGSIAYFCIASMTRGGHRPLRRRARAARRW